MQRRRPADRDRKEAEQQSLQFGARVPTPGTAEGGDEVKRPESLPPLPGKTPGCAEGELFESE